MGVIAVRLLEDHDEPCWRRLFAEYVAFYEAEIPDEVTSATWARLHAQSENMAGLIAINENGRAVGIANLVFHRSTWSQSWYCYLEDLFVDASGRGRGAGRALIEATYLEADRRGATRTYWATAHTNVTARHLYDRVGVLTPFVQYRR